MPPPPPAPGNVPGGSLHEPAALAEEFEKRLKEALHSERLQLDIEGYPASAGFAGRTVDRLNDVLWEDPDVGGIRYTLEGDAARAAVRVMSGYRYSADVGWDVRLRVTIREDDERLLVFFLGTRNRGSTGVLWKGQYLRAEGGTASMIFEAVLAGFRIVVPGGATLRRDCFELVE